MPSPTPHIAGGALPPPEPEIRCPARTAGKELEALSGIQPSLLMATEAAARYGLSRTPMYRVELAEARARPLSGRRHLANLVTISGQGVAW
jgi:hypothetical protein